jgi:hypothetical protein
MSDAKRVNLVIPSRNAKAGIIGTACDFGTDIIPATSKLTDDPCVRYSGLTNCGKTSVFNMLTDSNAIVDSTAFTTIGRPALSLTQHIISTIKYSGIESMFYFTLQPSDIYILHSF